MSLSRTLLPDARGAEQDARLAVARSEKLMSSRTGGPSKAIETLRKATTEVVIRGRTVHGRNEPGRMEAVVSIIGQRASHHSGGKR
jgi:hypothetical protein